MNITTKIDFSKHAVKASNQQGLHITADAILNSNQNIIAQCSNTELFEIVAYPLTQIGVQCKLINLQDMKHSCNYNPLFGISHDNPEEACIIAKAILGFQSYSTMDAADFMAIAITYLQGFLPPENQNIYQVYKFIKLGINDDTNNSSCQTALDVLMEHAQKQKPKAMVCQLYEQWVKLHNADDRQRTYKNIIRALDWIIQPIYQYITATDYEAKRNKDGHILEYQRDINQGYIPTSKNVICEPSNKRTVVFILDNPDAATPELYPCLYEFKQMVLQTLRVKTMRNMKNTLAIVQKESEWYLIPQDHWNTTRLWMYDSDVTKIQVATPYKSKQKLKKYTEWTDEYIRTLQVQSTIMYKDLHDYRDLHDIPLEEITNGSILPKKRLIRNKKDLLQALHPELPQSYPLEIITNKTMYQEAQKLRDKLDDIFLQYLQIPEGWMYGYEPESKHEQVDLGIYDYYLKKTIFGDLNTSNTDNSNWLLR